MPKPFFHKVFGHTMERLGAEDGMSGEEWFFAQVESGVSMKAIARQLGCSRPFLYVWLNQQGHEERRKALLEEARRRSAEVHAEDGLEILDDLAGSEPTPADVTLANSRANYRKWLASVRDREAFGDRKGGDVNVNLSIGEMHLKALMERGRPMDEIGNVREAEVLAIEDGE